MQDSNFILASCLLDHGLYGRLGEFRIIDRKQNFHVLFRALPNHIHSLRSRPFNMCDWEGCTTGTIGLPSPNQRRVAKTSGFLHP
jgi:hypothetical protein